MAQGLSPATLRPMDMSSFISSMKVQTAVCGKASPGHPWDIIRAMHIPRKATLQRFRDVPFALDQMEKSLTGKIDMTRLGFCGHSFGAMTTQVMAGQYRGVGRHRYQLTEPRIKAGILYSSGPAKHHSQYEGIRIPLMTMTGTDDASPLGEFKAEDRQDIFKHATAFRAIYDSTRGRRSYGFQWQPR